MTSIGMSSFSLFLRPMEADFGWSRAMVTLPYMFAMLGWLMAAGFFGMSLSLNVLQLSLTYGLMVGLAMGACGLAIASPLV
jgi:hypothetical protein